MQLDLTKLQVSFSKPPLLFGGKAMEYYGIRKSGRDIDLLVCRADLQKLIKKYPHSMKDLGGDLGVVVDEYEIWKTICFFDYDFWAKDAVNQGQFLVISLEKLMMQKVLAMKETKYLNDLFKISGALLDQQSRQSQTIALENANMISGIQGVDYLEKR